MQASPALSGAGSAQGLGASHWSCQPGGPVDLAFSHLGGINSGCKWEPLAAWENRLQKIHLGEQRLWEVEESIQCWETLVLDHQLFVQTIKAISSLCRPGQVLLLPCLWFLTGQQGIGPFQKPTLSM